MIIDFNTTEKQVIPNFKGGDGEITAQMFFDGVCRVMKGVLKPGSSIGEHLHDTNCEILFVLQGAGTIIDDGVAVPIGVGQCNYCPKGHRHSLVNTGNDDLVFYAAVPNL